MKSVRTAPKAIFQFRIRGCIRFVAAAFRSEEEVLWRKGPSLTYLQSSKDITSPMSETCKIRTGQVKFQDYKPGLVKLSKVNLRNIGQNKPEFLSLKVNRGRYADLFNQRQKWVPL